MLSKQVSMMFTDIMTHQVKERTIVLRDNQKNGPVHMLSRRGCVGFLIFRDRCVNRTLQFCLAVV